MADTPPITAPRSTVEAVAVRGDPQRCDEFAIRLRGVPALGRWTLLLSRVPLLTAWVRPRLYLDDVCLVLGWGPWLRRIPLSTIVRISTTARGLALGLSDSTKIELVTCGGFSCNRHRQCELSERLCAHLHVCRGRALARALRSYRTSGAWRIRASVSGSTG